MTQIVGYDILKQEYENRSEYIEKCLPDLLQYLTPQVAVWKNGQPTMKTPTTVADACGKFGISPAEFYRYINRNPIVAKQLDVIKRMAMVSAQAQAEKNVMDVVTGEVETDPQFRAAFSLKFLEKTSKNYNPAILAKEEENEKLKYVVRPLAEIEATIKKLLPSIQISESSNS